MSTLTSQQSWKIRTSWRSIEPLICSKGFGSLQKVKLDVGIPSVKVHVATSNHKEEVEKRDENTAQDLKEIFSQLKPQHTMTTTFYHHLFESNPQMKEIFWRFNLHQTLYKIVSTVATEDLKTSLHALAQRHRGRGIENEDYDIIGKSVIHAFEEHSHALSPSEIEAWRVAWVVFADSMKVKEVKPIEPDEKIMNTKYDMNEVKKHNSVNDAWLVYDGKVYDVTKYISSHPGGVKILLGLGKDATHLMNNIKHSINAYNILSHYQIGYLHM